MMFNFRHQTRRNDESAAEKDEKKNDKMGHGDSMAMEPKK